MMLITRHQSILGVEGHDPHILEWGVVEDGASP